MKNIRYLKPVITTFLLLCLVAAMGVGGAIYSSKKSQAIAKQTLPSLSHLALANQYRGQAFLHLILSISTLGEADFKTQKSQISCFSDKSYQELDLYENYIVSVENRSLYNQVMEERSIYIKTRVEILALIESGNKAQAILDLNERLLPMYERYLNKAQTLVNYASQEGIDRAESIHLISLWSLVFGVISSILIFIFGFVLGYTR